MTLTVWTPAGEKTVEVRVNKRGHIVPLRAGSGIPDLAWQAADELLKTGYQHHLWLPVLSK